MHLVQSWNFSGSTADLSFPCKEAKALFNGCSFSSDGTEKTSTFASRLLKVEH